MMKKLVVTLVCFFSSNVFSQENISFKEKLKLSNAEYSKPILFQEVDEDFSIKN
jgi:hypothetical protein